MLKCSIFLKSILSARIPNNFANNIDFFSFAYFCAVCQGWAQKTGGLEVRGQDNAWAPLEERWGVRRIGPLYVGFQV